MPRYRIALVYVLGCFARHVTLYSQQVRAFNLVYGLHLTGKLRQDGKTAKVAVIGARAAGLAAAAAFAHASCGCEVTLLEELDGMLNLQSGSHHRWVHPHIYDWPSPGSREERSGLPIFDWKAATAENVSKQIQDRWEELKKNLKIKTAFGVSAIRLSHRKGADGKEAGYTLGGIDDSGNTESKRIDILVLAIGFGLEPEQPPSISYWTPDSVDKNLRKRQGQRWLISGFGDGALTDVMRACIRNFRHAEVVSLIGTGKGANFIGPLLLEMHRDPHLPNEELSKRFHALSTAGYEEALRPLLRKDGPEVFLTGLHPHVYGRGSSILNRLIVLLLSRLGAFTFLPGPSGEVEELPGPSSKEEQDDGTIKTRMRVQIQGPSCLSQEFEGLRPCHLSTWHQGENHGFCRTAAEEGGRMRRFEGGVGGVLPESDGTRVKHWQTGFFGPELAFEEMATPVPAGPAATPPNRQARLFEAQAERFRAKIASLAFDKQMRTDGSCTVTYAITGLAAVGRPLLGVRFFYKSGAGKVGPPQLDSDSLRLGLRWRPDDEGTEAGTIEKLSERVSKISGTVVFKKPLDPEDQPMRFVLKVIVLNGDALSKWEFEQFYDEERRIHEDMEPLTAPIEYFARYVCCPVQQLSIRITLPSALLGPPVWSAFQRTFGVSAEVEIQPGEVVRNSVLQLYPPADSASNPDRERWVRQKQTTRPRLTNPSAQTWELTVEHPGMASCYSLDWALPEAVVEYETETTARQAREFRALLVRRIPALDPNRGRRTEARMRQKFRRLF